MSVVTNITNQLNMIYNIKNDIKSSLNNLGQNMTGVNFENYSEKIDNITCNLLPTRFPDINDEQVAKLPYMYNFANYTNMVDMFNNCYGLVNIPEFNTSNVTNMAKMFYGCNNLSNESIQNIVNMCLNSNITNTMQKNLSNIITYSPLNRTKFNNSYYSNRLSDLSAAGWTY